jgi:hypothetical protein
MNKPTAEQASEQERDAVNPTPFVLAKDAKWRHLPCGSKFLPARAYLSSGIPAIVIQRGKRKAIRYIIIGEHAASGFSGIMLDVNGKYAGSIRKSIARGK